MIVAPVRSPALTEGVRLDAGYFAAPAVRIRTMLAKATGVQLRRIDEVGTVRAPSRFKRTYAVPGEQFVSYLRPYDVFEYLPPEADRLSATRTENLDSYLIRDGDLLQTCSGRNLGPLTIADAYLSGFALSHDMVRITIEDQVDRFYAMAFLQSTTGQHLLRGDLSGSVIDHITSDQVGAIQIPFIDSIYADVSDLMCQATALREQARIALHSAVEAINSHFTRPESPPGRDGWTVKAANLGSRLDVAFHSAHTAAVRQVVRDSGGVALGDVATITKPGGRYKTYYVAAGHGTPLLSGRQILQLNVIGAKNISERSVAPDAGYELRDGSICFQADGRAEESLGYPSVVTRERDGWFASGHVGRAVPHDPDDAGWIWAALASDVAQEQVAALACGSVVDALYPEDLAGITIPPRDLVDSRAVKAAWDRFAEAAEYAALASDIVEDTVRGLGV